MLNLFVSLRFLFRGVGYLGLASETVAGAWLNALRTRSFLRLLVWQNLVFVWRISRRRGVAGGVDSSSPSIKEGHRHGIAAMQHDRTTERVGEIAITARQLTLCSGVPVDKISQSQKKEKAFHSRSSQCIQIDKHLEENI